MQQINLTFGLESSSGHWSKIFEGFDQETILTTRFEGNSTQSINLLYKFGSIIYKHRRNFSVEPHNYGIIIRKHVNETDKVFIDEWMNLMKELKDEISELSNKIN